MKKAVLTEINEIKKMMGLVTEQEQVNYSECLSMIPDFYFKKTTGMETQDYNGGDLGFWNDNKIPEFDDKELYVRFIDHVKGAVGYKNGVYSAPEMIWDEDCGDVPSWEELLPHIKFMYFDTIMKKNRMGEEKTVEDIPELIAHFSEELEYDEDYGSEFNWADDVIGHVVDVINQHQNLSDKEYDDLYNDIKDKYGPELTGFENPFD
jgi:hypothetical protein